MERHELRSRWVRMLSRCEDPGQIQYKDYGGRGIYVSAEWQDFNNFYNWCENNHIETHLQVDRIDSDGPYDPGNCRLVTRKENARNKRNNVILTIGGESKTMVEWSEDSRCTVSYKTLGDRIRAGEGHEEAITHPDDRTVKPPANCNVLTAFGESKSTSEWLKDSRSVVSWQLLWKRIDMGWDIERALTEYPAFNAGLEFEGHNILYWSKQPECEVSYNTLSRRLKSGESLAIAMLKQSIPRGAHIK